MNSDTIQSVELLNGTWRFHGPRFARPKGAESTGSNNDSHVFSQAFEGSALALALRAETPYFFDLEYHGYFFKIPVFLEKVVVFFRSFAI